MNTREKSVGKFLLLAFMFLVAFSCLLNVGAVARAAESGPIRIGAIEPYTWEDPTIVLVDKAIKMRIEEYGGKVAGRTIEFIGEDDAGNAVKAVEKAKKLVEMNKVAAIIGPIPANNALAVANYTAASKIPQFSIVQMPFAGNKNPGRNVYSIAGTQQGSTIPLGQYAYDIGYRTVSVLHQDFVAGEELAKGFIDAFEAKGGKVIQRQKVPVGTMDYAPFVGAIQKADAFVTWLLPQEQLRLNNQYFNAGPKMPYILLNGAFPAEMLQQTGDKTLGIVSVIRWTRFDPSPENKKFLDTFVKKYGEYPTTNAVAAYDQMGFLLEALKATSGDTNPDALNAALKKVKLTLGAGVTRYSEEGVAIGDMSIVRVDKVEGKHAWVPIKKFSQVLYKAAGEK
jgi:branched-chain amino acid transport system substrate-binding protein